MWLIQIFLLMNKNSQHLYWHSLVLAYSYKSWLQSSLPWIQFWPLLDTELFIKWNQNIANQLSLFPQLQSICQIFLICLIKSTQCTDKYRKKKSIAIFLPLYFDVQNHETKNRRLGTTVTSSQDFKLREKQCSLTFSYFLINNVLLYHVLANWLAHNKKMTEKSAFVFFLN